MTVFQSIPTESPWTNSLADFDPRSKMLMVLIIIGAILSLSLKQPIRISLLSIAVLVLIFMSRKDLFSFIHSILRILPMMLIITLVLPFRSVSVTTEMPLAEWGILALYPSGIERFLEINIKFVLILSATLVLISTTSVQQLLQGMESFRLPSWLSAILYLMVYFVFVLNDELSRQYLAFKSRYIYLSPRRRIVQAGKMVAVYFIRIIGRSERATMAMISRGFTGKIYGVKILTWKRRDTALVVLAITFVVSITVLF